MANPLLDKLAHTPTADEILTALRPWKVRGSFVIECSDCGRVIDFGTNGRASDPVGLAFPQRNPAHDVGCIHRDGSDGR